MFIRDKLVMVPLRRRIPSHGAQGSSCMQYCNVEGAERGTVGKESKGKIDLGMIEMLRIAVRILA